MFSLVFLVIILKTTVAEICDSKGCADSVCLSVIEQNTCPSEPVTVQCITKKPAENEDFFLSWNFNGESDECPALCSPGRVLCSSKELYDVKVTDCTCNNTVIISEATFNRTSQCNVMLICTNGKGSQQQQISATIEGFNTPSLSMDNAYSVYEVNDGLIYEVTLFWTEDQCSPHDVEYSLTIFNSSFSTNYFTTWNNMTLNVSGGIEYSVTVTAQLCEGNITSRSSDPFILHFPVTPTPTDINEADNIAGVVGGSVAAVVAVATVATVCIIVFIKKKKTMKKKTAQSLQKNKEATEQVDFAIRFEVVSDHPGRKLTPLEKKTFTKRGQDDTRKRSGVSSVYVEDEFIIYSCTKEPEDSYTKEYIIRKCGRDGKFVFAVHGFSPVRGIGRDAKGNYYVVDSVNSRVLKFDEEFNPMLRTSDKCDTILNDSFGILVETSYIFVCAKRKKEICIFNHGLDLLYKINGIGFSPIDIAKIGKDYFVSTNSAILLIDLDIDKKSVENFHAFKCFSNGSNTEVFEPNLELRGICAIDRYLYVSEQHKNGRLMCLEFTGKELRYIDAIQKCAPNAVSHHNGKIYYSEGVFNGKFYIVEVTHKGDMKRANRFSA